MPQSIREAGALLASASGQPATRRPIQIITPGWGSSGYYSADVLQEAATNRVIPAGTHMYFNHASVSEREDRPERDVRDIAAVLVEDARWDGTRLVADADILGPHAELIEALAPYIGVSISGSATDITVGEAEGRRGPIIEGLADVASVDFVTHAGRGGMVLLESARPSRVTALARARGVDEATMNDTQDALRTTLRDAHGGEDTYVWVRDFDDTQVWFEVESPDENGLYAQQYSGSGSAVELTGDRTEVRVVTTYVPVTRPGSTNTTTEESEEDTMPQIEEARLRELEEAHGRVPTLESERDTAIRERDDATRALSAERALSRARTLISENEARRNAGVEFTALEERGLLATLPMTDAGALDEDTFTTTVSEAATDAAATRGAGSVRGFGGTSTGGGEALTESDIDKAVAHAFGRKGA